MNIDDTMKLRQVIRVGIAVFAATLLVPVQGHSACTERTSSSIHVMGDVVIDDTSGLVWKRCAAAAHWNSRTKRCEGDVRGMSHSEALSVARQAGAGWRVPTDRELASLRLNTCKGPKIDTRAFPNIDSVDFGEGANVWTSSQAISSDTFYYVNFTDGSFDFHSDGFALGVLLVRNK